MKITSPAVQNVTYLTHVSFISELTSTVPLGGYEEYIYRFSPNGSKNKWCRTLTVFLPISEVCDGTVSLKIPDNLKAIIIAMP